MNIPFFGRRRQADTQTFNDSEVSVEQAAPVPFIISGNMNITLVLEGQNRSVAADHPNHSLVLDAIREERWADLPNLVDIPKAINTYSEGRVIVNEQGEVTYDGEPVHSTVAKRITMFFQQGLDFKPLVRFLENLMTNPSRRAVEELYGFLENEGMAITEDGCFVGYKGVRNDFMDRYSGRFDNSPGQILEMPRNLVDDDARRGCSNGFHVGSQSYASSWATSDGRLLLVKVNPADAVSVPYESCEKLRVCRYEVIREVAREDIIQSPLFDSDRLAQDQDDEEDEFDDWLQNECEYCDDPDCEGECEDNDPDCNF